MFTIRYSSINDFPKHKDGVNKGCINWNEIIGNEFEFIKDGEFYYFEILKKDNVNITINFNNKIQKISIKALKKGVFRELLKVDGGYKYNIGDVIRTEFKNIKIIDRKIVENKCNSGINRRKKYKYECLNCGFNCGECYVSDKKRDSYWLIESNIEKHGCACCCSPSKVIVEGINDVSTIAPWMVKYFANPEDAKKYTYGCDKKVNLKCIDCGEIIYSKFTDLYKNGYLSCKCRDSFSYPEKLIYSILKNINMEYITEFKTKWSNGARYDFHIPNLNMIIETHGIQHYKENAIWNRTLEQEQENDKNKRGLALKNGIKHYIELDCRESNLEWIRNSILNSKLNELFDLSKIDWLKCEEFSLKNLVKEVCNYWNNKEEWETTKDLGRVFKLSSPTIVSYLKKGTKLGWCSYNPKEENIKASSKAGKCNSKRVSIINDKDEIIGIYDSATELDRISKDKFGIKMTFNGISSVCTGVQKTHRGYKFKYC